jgi:hypothetical protein
VQKPLNVPRYLPGKERAYAAQTGFEAIAATTWEVARVFAIEPEYADMLGIARPLLEQTPSLIQTGRRA